MSERQRLNQQHLFIGGEAARCLIPETVTVYASGTNRLADIRGAILAGVPIGVDVSKLSQLAMDEIIRSSLPVFLDSGAFGEVAIHKGHIHVVAPINNTEWRKRLGRYLTIASAYAHLPNRRSIPAVTVVAPDQVGSQEVTLERMSAFRSEILVSHAAGADVLVPLQVGELSLVEFYESARNLLGIDIVPGMPMKKCATTPAAVFQFVVSTRPRRLHLLGMGINNKLAWPLIRLLHSVQPALHVSLDSNKIRAAVGQRRPITESEQRYREELVEGWTGEVDLRAWGEEVYDITESIFRPWLWMSSRELAELAGSFTWLSSDECSTFLADPEGFLSDADNLNDWMCQTLMGAYHAYVQNRAKACARTKAVAETFDESTIGGHVSIGLARPSISADHS